LLNEGGREIAAALYDTARNIHTEISSTNFSPLRPAPSKEGPLDEPGRPATKDLHEHPKDTQRHPVSVSAFASSLRIAARQNGAAGGGAPHRGAPVVRFALAQRVACRRAGQASG
jgi:hypothetical protein